MTWWPPSLSILDPAFRRVFLTFIGDHLFQAIAPPIRYSIIIGCRRLPFFIEQGQIAGLTAKDPLRKRRLWFGLSGFA